MKLHFIGGPKDGQVTEESTAPDEVVFQLLTGKHTYKLFEKDGFAAIYEYQNHEYYIKQWPDYGKTYTFTMTANVPYYNKESNPWSTYPPYPWNKEEK